MRTNNRFQRLKSDRDYYQEIIKELQTQIAEGRSDSSTQEYLTSYKADMEDIEKKISNREKFREYLIAQRDLAASGYKDDASRKKVQDIVAAQVKQVAQETLAAEQEKLLMLDDRIKSCGGNANCVQRYQSQKEQTMKEINDRKALNEIYL